jgi:hypothetical protein
MADFRRRDVLCIVFRGTSRVDEQFIGFAREGQLESTRDQGAKHKPEPLLRCRRICLRIETVLGLIEPLGPDI